MPLQELTELRYFPMMHEAHASNYRVLFSAELSAPHLDLRFKIESDFPEEYEKIIFPDLSTHSSRKNNLWTTTCFECFIPLIHSTAYIEINLSPSGNWNLYVFRKYRDGAKEFKLEAEALPRQLGFLQGECKIQSDWRIPMDAIRQGFLSIGEKDSYFDRIGVATVLNTKETTTYWSLHHSGVKPDFHLRESFIYPVTMKKTQG